MNRLLSLLPPLIAVATFAACADPERVARRDIPETYENDCTFFRSLYDWRALDNRNMIIWGPSKQAYHVTLNFPSRQLRFANTVVFVDENRDGRLCGFGMDTVVVPGTIPEQLTIGGMCRLNEKELAAMLDDNRNTAGEMRRNATDSTRDQDT